MLLDRKLDILALSEAKLKGREDEFFWSGLGYKRVNYRTREGVW